MSGSVFLGLLSRGNAVRARYGLNLWKRLNCRSHNGAQKIEETTNKKVGNFLPFKDFKDKHVENWESFKESLAANALYRNDLEKISKPYRRFCLSEYSQHRHQVYGSNPSLII